MAKSTKSLSGVDKDAYLERAAALDSEAHDGQRLAVRLKAEVTRVWVRVEALGTAEAGAADDGAVLPDDFDPYVPNVIVILRTVGREPLMAALRQIGTTDQLRRLAREQQLGVDAGVSDAEDLRLAIISAAERRVANRRAAAS